MITEESVLKIVKERNGRVITPLEIMKKLCCEINDTTLAQLEEILRKFVQENRVLNIPASSLMYKINQ